MGRLEGKFGGWREAETQARAQAAGAGGVRKQPFSLAAQLQVLATARNEPLTVHEEFTVHECRGLPQGRRRRQPLELGCRVAGTGGDL